MGTGMNLWGRRKDGSDFPVEVSLNYIKNTSDETMVVALVSDISVRKRAQDEVLKVNQNLEQLVEQRSKALFKSEQLYKSIAKNYPSGIIYMLNLEYIIRFVEGKELERHGKTPEDCIGKNYIETCDNEASRVSSLLHELVQEGSVDMIEIEKRGQFYSLTASLIRDEFGELTNILVVENNITQQRKNADFLERNLREEKQLGELKSRFVSMASHEFRTPLTTVASSAGLIKRYAENGDQEKIAKHADRIQNTVGHMTNLLNDFLSLEKLESGKQEMKTAEFDVCSCISEIKEDMFGVLKENQRLILSGDNVTIFSDPFFLKAILINLISNAIKYSPEGADINVNWKVKDNQICIDVIDQGIGIPEEEQKLMFTRFFRAANATNIEGTGLGLFIVTKYLDLMRGEINFNSKVNTGSTFTLKIPITY
jgi:signal transduction histidine kinase